MEMYNYYFEKKWKDQLKNRIKLTLDFGVLNAKGVFVSIYEKWCMRMAKYRVYFYQVL